MSEKWEDNNIQYPRFLAEIRAIGLTPGQYIDLQEATDLTVEEIDEIFERAEDDWQEIKSNL